MVTITDVAERAGVSIKTVSRVMNNYEHISTKMRDKVQRAMVELSYEPGASSGRMHMLDQRSIGILYSDPGGGYPARLNRALLQACRAARRYLAVEIFDETNPDWRSQVEGFLHRTKVRNVILVPPICDSSDVHALLKEKEVGFALISPSRPVSGASSIVMDDRLAAMEVTQHLIDLGHTRIGHIGGDTGHVVTLLRRQGFEEALVKAGLGAPDPSLLASGRFNFKDALIGADKMLTAKNRPTAIFAANDEMAAAVIMAANRLGISVPGELSVAGFDDTRIAQTIWPELTTIAQPFEAIAKEAVRLSNELRPDEGSISAARVLPHRLIVRGSTGPNPRV